MDKYCKICGSLYVAKSSKSIYCSNKCKQSAYRYNKTNGEKSKRQPNKLLPAQHCVVCAKLYQPKSAKSQYCSNACRQQHFRSRQKTLFNNFSDNFNIETGINITNALKTLKNSVKICVVAKNQNDAEFMDNLFRQIFYGNFKNPSMPSLSKNKKYPKSWLQNFDIEPTEHEVKK